MQQPVVVCAGTSDAASHRDRHAFGGQIKVRKNPDQQIAIEIGQSHADDALQIEKLGGVGAGLDDLIVGFADDQQSPMRLNRSRKVNLFPLAVREIGFSERWGSDGMQRQINPLGFPRRPPPCLRGRND